MTDTNHPVRRRTLAPHRGRRIVVILGPGDIIGFRAERTRRVFETTIAACMDMAVRQQVAADRATRKAARKR
jgi:hypothetical protein